MQIQTVQSFPTLAAAAASPAIVKDRSATATTSATELAATLATESVGKSEEACADRDAQGGGEGLGHQAASSDAKGRSPVSPIESDFESDLAAIPPDPPSQLDLLG